MRYLVVLDASSAIGAAYASGRHDGMVKGGARESNPAIDCYEISLESPVYLLVHRGKSATSEDRQTVLIPHGSVVAIFRYNEGEPRPIGFV
jgi:hypothetical protein